MPWGAGGGWMMAHAFPVRVYYEDTDFVRDILKK